MYESACFVRGMARPEGVVLSVDRISVVWASCGSGAWHIDDGADALARIRIGGIIV